MALHWRILGLMGVLGLPAAWGKEPKFWLTPDNASRSTFRYCNCPFDCLSTDGLFYHNISLSSADLRNLPPDRNSQSALRDKCMDKFAHVFSKYPSLGDPVGAPAPTPTRPPPPPTTSSEMEAHPNPPLHPNLELANVLTNLIEVLIYLAIGLTLVFILALPFLRSKPTLLEANANANRRLFTDESLLARGSHSSLGAHQSGRIPHSRSSASQVIIHLPSILEDATSLGRPHLDHRSGLAFAEGRDGGSRSSTSSLSTCHSAAEISMLDSSSAGTNCGLAASQGLGPSSTVLLGSTSSEVSPCGARPLPATLAGEQEKKRLSCAWAKNSLSEYYLNTIYGNEGREEQQPAQSANLLAASRSERNDKLLSLFDFKDLV